MPHLRCNSCGVVSYAPLAGAGSCPECGVPWPDRPDRVIQSADPEQRLGALVRMTRALLDVDLALLTVIAEGRETVRTSAGGWPEVMLRHGDSLPLEETFCRLMLEGRIGNVVCDTRAEPAVGDIELVRRLGARAYIGVPIRPSDAELYVLCCLARQARPSFGVREVRLLSGLAESVRAELQAR
jgi:GAF domain-containing protein